MADEFLLGSAGPERLNVNRQSVDVAASGTLIAGTAGVPIRVYALFLCVATTTTVVFKSGTTARTGAITLNAGVPFVLPYNPLGWLETIAGDDLVATLGAGVQVSGSITYGLRA